MLFSMTGFGKAVCEASERKITVEIKTLNSKQVDMSTHMPAGFRQAELDIRALVARELQRGKIDFSLAIDNREAAASSVARINVDAAAAYKRQIEEMDSALGIDAPRDWQNLLLHLPEVLRTDSESTAPDESVLADVMATVSEALSRVCEFRRAEGAKLEDFFRRKIEDIRGLLAEVPRHEEERVAKIRGRIEENLETLHGVNIDRARLEQEMIFYIEKLDINEEKLRLAAHLNYFLETMDGPEGQGKKLGFIAQEMGREINTLGSKSNHAEMQRLVVRMKDHLEQIKEQVLNVL